MVCRCSVVSLKGYLESAEHATVPRSAVGGRPAGPQRSRREFSGFQTDGHCGAATTPAPRFFVGRLNSCRWVSAGASCLFSCSDRRAGSLWTAALNPGARSRGAARRPDVGFGAENSGATAGAGRGRPNARIWFRAYCALSPRKRGQFTHQRHRKTPGMGAMTLFRMRLCMLSKVEDECASR